MIGHSARGTPIRAVRVGPARARVKLLVVGSVHGDEPAGGAIVARLRRSKPPRGTALWLIEDLNPDGHAAGTRQNANGVDLNRNFPYRWQADGARSTPTTPVHRRAPSPRRRRSSASWSASGRA